MEKSKQQTQKIIDLHTHSNESDGDFSPAELVAAAHAAGVTTLALTDHETVSGCEEALAAAGKLGIELIPGIEISCHEEEKGYTEVHVIGLFIDFKNKKVLDFCALVHEQRITQKRKMIKKLQEFGFDITFDEVVKLVGYSFGRPHVARVLVEKYPSKFPSVQSVFDQYIGTGKKAYVEREDKIPISDAVRLIHGAGGISVLAHPGVFSKKDAEKILDYFVSYGGMGVETYYSYDLVNGLTAKDSEELCVFFRGLARQYELLESGGSDYHGKKVRPTVVLGKMVLPFTVLEKMKACLR